MGIQSGEVTMSTAYLSIVTTQLQVSHNSRAVDLTSSILVVTLLLAPSFLRLIEWNISVIGVDTIAAIMTIRPEAPNSKPMVHESMSENRSPKNALRATRRLRNPEDLTIFSSRNTEAAATIRAVVRRTPKMGDHLLISSLRMNRPCRFIPVNLDYGRVALKPLYLPVLLISRDYLCYRAKLYVCEWADSSSTA